MEESRFALHSIPRRCLTVRGVKPIIHYQHRFQNCYFFGAYSPVNGDSLTLELPFCNSDMFQPFLDEFSQQKPQEFKILLLDNGAFHHTKELHVPRNIHLLFLPPYCPQLNPAEQIWRYIKDKIANTIFNSLQDLSDALVQVIRRLSHKTVHSITGWNVYRN